MAKGFKQGAGGGNPLNFKVVGNPQPETAKENTIWIDTDEKITGWDFSATQPFEPTEGMVWIKTGTASHAALNALKKNGIQLYPIAAFHYVNGAFVSCKLKVYTGGAWKDPSFYIIQNGKLVNGLSFANYSGASSVAEISGALRIVGTANASNVVYLSNAIDASNYSELVLETLGGATYYALEVGFNAAKKGRNDKYGGTFATEISWGSSAKTYFGAGTHSVNVPPGTQNVWLGISTEKTAGLQDANYSSGGIDIVNLFFR